MLYLHDDIFLSDIGTVLYCIVLRAVNALLDVVQQEH